MPPRQPKTDGEALLAAVCAAPDDDTPRLVYADWLEDHDRPDRAELIRVQVELAGLGGHDPRRPDLEMRAGELCLAQERDLLAKVPAWARKRVEFRRGFAEGIRVGLRTFLKNADGLFRRAPVTTVELTNVGGELDVLAHSPHLGAVRDLHLFDLDPEFLPALFRSPHLAGLRGLHFEQGTGYLARPIELRGFGHLAQQADVPGLAAASRLPPLRRLGLNNCQLDPAALAGLLARPELRGLRALSVRNTNLTPADIVAAVGPLAELRDLDIGQTWHSIDERVRVLVESPVVAGLTHLGLGNLYNFTDAGARMLAASPYLGNLTDLGLDGTGVTDAGLELLVRSPNLPRLTRIGVFGNRLDRPRWDFWECRRAPSRWWVQWVWLRR